MKKRSVKDIARQTKIHKPNISTENHLEFWQQTISEHYPHLGINLIDIKDVTQIPPSVISDIIIQAKDENYTQINEYLWNSSVASVDEIIEDIEHGIETDEIMFTGTEMAQSLIIRATPGHAQNGHSTFYENKHNTCITDVLDAIEKIKPKKFRGPNTREYFQKTSQANIDNIVYCMEDWFDHIEQNLNHIDSESSIVRLNNRDGTPLNEFLPFTKIPIDILEMARGFRFTTLMDNLPKIRKPFHNKYGHSMGGGESYLTVTSKLKEYGIDIPHLSKINYQTIFKILNFITPEDRIDILTKLGIIKNDTINLEGIINGECTWDEIKSSPNVTNLLQNPHFSIQYARREKGMGVGDDLSICLSACLPQTYTKQGHIESPYSRQSRIFGGLMGDKIDTLEKDAELFMPGGQDEIAGHYINGRFRKLCKERKFREAFNIKYRKDGQYNLLSKEAIIDFTGASANTATEHVHSSQRWFYKQVQNTCAISEYFRHLYSHANEQEKKILKHNLQNFVDFEKEPPKNTRLTFRQIPLEKIKTIINERSALVADPSQREKNLYTFYSK